MMLNNDYVQELMLYILYNNKLPGDSDKFEDGTLMLEFLEKNKEIIYKNESNDNNVNVLINCIKNVESDYFKENYKKKISLVNPYKEEFDSHFRAKNFAPRKQRISKVKKALTREDYVNELLTYISQNKHLPDGKVLFSNGRPMRKYLLTHARGIYRNKNDEKSALLVKELSSIDAHLFDNIYEVSEEPVVPEEKIEKVKTEVKISKPKEEISEFERRLLEVYYDIDDFEKYGTSVPIKFEDGMKIRDWVLENKNKINEIGNNVTDKIINHYFNEKNDFASVLQEVSNYIIKNNYKFPFNDFTLSSGTLFSDWFKQNRNRINDYIKYDDRRAKIVIGFYYNGIKYDFFEEKIAKIYKELKSDSIDKSDISWVNSNGDNLILRQNFDDRIKLIVEKLLPNYLTFEKAVGEITAIFNKHSFEDVDEQNIKLSNGVSVKSWVKKNKVKLVLNRFIDDDVYSICREFEDCGYKFSKNVYLSHEKKLNEVLIALKSLKRIPRGEDSIRFSDGTKIGRFLDFSRVKIYTDDNFMAQMLVQRLLEIEPGYFDFTKKSITKRKVLKK